MKVRVSRMFYLNALFYLWLHQSAPCSSPIEDPFTCTPSPQVHNEQSCQELEEEEVSSLVIIPDCDFCQACTSGGKLAYVIFGDQTKGGYYNWYVFISSYWVIVVKIFQYFKEFV